MREIRFRAWDKELKVMGRIDTWYFLDLDGKGSQSMLVKFKHKTKLSSHKDKDGFVIMQFTGLKDKNGKEIFEGDIVELWEWVHVNAMKREKQHHIAKIEWWDLAAKYVAIFKDGNTFLNLPLMECEVIGNIFENPELIK